MKKWLIVCLIVLVVFPDIGWAQQDSSYVQKVNQYISQYKDLAMIEQMYSGMPAAVILAQAILETEAGTSELVKGANNHFGIKCKSNWTGATFTHTDDEADECFRKYRSVAESYKDHSDYLKKTPRYASLFKLSVTDYAGWAIGLKQCGYATNPIYSQKLIGLIEDYHLQQYTYQVLNEMPDATAAEIKENVSATPQPVKPKTAPLAKTDTFAFKSKAKIIADSVKKPIAANTAHATDTTPKKNSAIIAKYEKPLRTKDSSYKKDTAIAETPAKQVMLKDTIPRKDTVAVLQKHDTAIVKTIQEATSAKTLQKTGDTTIAVKDTLAKVAKADTAINKIPVNINSSPAANPIATTPAKPSEEPRVVTFHEHKAIFVHKGDILLEYATTHNIRYAKLLDMNDMQDGPVEADMYIYLEKKNSSGTHPYHIVQEGETIHQVSQIECMQLKRLMSFNHLEAGQEPVPGTKLFLKDDAPQKAIIIPSAIIKRPAAADSANAKRAAGADSYINTTSPSVAPPDVAQNIPIGNADNAASDVPATTDETANAKKEADHEKLAKLKAKLDKVVYSNDNNTTATPAQSPADIITEMAGPAQKPVAKPKEDSSRYYIVKNGDTFISIANHFGITVYRLKLWNGLDDVALKNGMKLRVKE